MPPKLAVARFPALVRRLSRQWPVGTVEAMSETALHAHLVARGAVHADDRGIALPRHFGDPEAEYRALVGGAAVLDLGFRTLVRAVGPDRAPFLQGMLTNDVERLPPGPGGAAAPLPLQSARSA